MLSGYVIPGTLAPQISRSVSQCMLSLFSATYTNLPSLYSLLNLWQMYREPTVIETNCNQIHLCFNESELVRKEASRIGIYLLST